MFKLIAIWGTVAALGTVVVSLPSNDEALNHCTKGRIVSEAQFAVERFIRDVKTAEFSKLETKEGLVTGKVRAQNIFGAYVEHNFVASVDCVNNKPVVKGIILN